MAEAEFNYNSRQNITKMRTERLKERIRRLTGQDKKIAEALVKSGGRYCNTTDRESGRWWNCSIRTRG